MALVKEKLPEVYYLADGDGWGRSYDALCTNDTVTPNIPAGWITAVGCWIASKSGTIDYKLGIWSAANQWKIYEGPLKSAGTGELLRKDASLAIRWGGGKVLVGAWHYPAETYPWKLGIWDTPYGLNIDYDASTFPARIQFNTGLYSDNLAYRVEYVPNATPLGGAFEAPTPLTGVAAIRPTFRGTTPHPTADSAYDYTSEVHLQVWRTSDGVMAYDTLFATTQAEKDGDYFERAPVELLPSTEYAAKFRHRDSFGVYSTYSDTITFVTVSGPDQPSPTAPIGKIDQISGYSYQAVYTHPNGLAADAWQVQVYNTEGTTLLYDSGVVAISAASGETLSMLEFHADLAWATSYKWRAQVRDTNSGWSGYCPFEDFNTDAPPSAPVLTTPVDNKTTSSLTFTATAEDPDSDAIATALMEIANADTGAAVKVIAWAVKTSYATLAERRPTTANNLRYQAQNQGTSGPTQPTWPTASGATVRDNAGMVVVPDDTNVTLGAAYLKPGGASTDTEWYEVTTAGKTAAAGAHPAYPTTEGVTVKDGTDVAQVDTVEIVAANSTAYTVTIDSTSVSFTSDADATEGEIALGLVAAINNDATLAPKVTAATSALAGDAAANFTVTADVAGVPFTMTVGANLTRSTTTANVTAAILTTRKTITWKQMGPDTQFSMVVTNPGGKLSLTLPSGTITLDTNYRWRAAADDGLGPGLGAFAEYEFFRFALVPNAQVLSPAATRTNISRQPSAEYENPIGTANLLTANQSSVETDTTGFDATNATIAHSTAQTLDGLASLSLSITAAQETLDAYARVVPISPVYPSHAYSVTVNVYAPVACKVTRPRLYHGTTVFAEPAIELIDLAAGWNTITFSGTSPATIDNLVVLILRPARKADNTAYDSTITLYYDKLQVEQSQSPTAWNLGGQTGYLTQTARSATDYVNRITDGDAAFGLASHEGVASATGDNRVLTPLEPVDATKPYLARVHLKTKTGTPASHYAILCYDGANALLGTIYPQSIALAQGVNVPTTWTPYGGIVWPAGSASTPAFPTGTTQIRREVTPSRLSEATVRFDAESFEQLPLHSEADWNSGLQRWYGYGDPDTETYGVGGYAWNGTEGDSTQAIIPILTELPQNLAISYSSDGGYAKKDDRIFIDEWNGKKFVRIHTGGFPTTATDRTLIPIPGGHIKNQGRYRIQVEVRDINESVGASDWVEFDVRYEGVPELNILITETDNQRAVLRITFESTSLTAQEFAGIEIARETIDGEEPLQIFEKITDPTATSAAYHFPISGREYRLKIRQIKNVGAEQLQGRWNTATFTPDYSGYYFIKAADDPENLWAKYKVFRDAPQDYHTSPALETSFFPWGSEGPLHLSTPRTRAAGEVIARFLFDLEEQSTLEGYKALKEILSKPRPICLLAQHPDQQRVFAARIGSPVFGTPGGAAMKRSIKFAWEETSYSEDYYERTGQDG